MLRYISGFQQQDISVDPFISILLLLINGLITNFGQKISKIYDKTVNNEHLQLHMEKVNKQL